MYEACEQRFSGLFEDDAELLSLLAQIHDTMQGLSKEIVRQALQVKRLEVQVAEMMDRHA